MYDAAIRTPLVPLDLPRSGTAERPRDLPQARDAAADRLLQDPRRLQRRAPPDARRSSRRASGPSAPATPRRASRSPRARRARACSVMVMDTAPETKLARHRAPRRDDRQGVLRRVLADGRDARLAAHDAATSSTRSTTTTSSAATARSGSRSSRTCRTSTRSSRRSAAAGCSPASACALRALRPGGARSTRPSRRPRRRSSASFDDGQGQPLRGVAGRRSSTAPAASRSSTRCGRCSREYVHESIVVSLDEAARAMRLVAERVHVIAEGRRRVRRRRRALAGDGGARPQEGRRRRVGRQRRSRAFAQLVGACA